MKRARFIDNTFNGKLGIESKRLKKKFKEVPEGPENEEPPEAENLQTTEDPAESLAVET